MQNLPINPLSLQIHQPAAYTHSGRHLYYPGAEVLQNKTTTLREQVREQGVTGPLYLEFTALAPNCDADVLAFAHRFGRLEYGVGSSPPNEGETFVAWHNAIATLAWTVDLYRTLRGPEAEREMRLDNLLQRADEAAYFIRGPVIDGRIRAILVSTSPPVDGEHDLTAVGWAALHQVLVENTQDAVAAKLVRQDARFAFEFHAQHLLAAMWLEFSQTVIEEGEIRSCAACKKLFEAGVRREHGARRADAKTCSNKCRVKAHRQGQRFRKRP